MERGLGTVHNSNNNRRGREPEIRLDMLRAFPTPPQIYLAFLASLAYKYMHLAIKGWTEFSGFSQGLLTNRLQGSK
jgi:hypothetical protein